MTAAFEEVMEQTGFYRNGKPIAGVIDANSLRKQIDKRIKYSAVVDPKKLDATAIFELSGSPCIYFKFFDHPDPTALELATMHKIAWNQGLAPMLWVVTPTQVLLYNCYSKPTPEDTTNPNRHLIDLFRKTEEGLRQLNEFAGRLQLESGRFWQHEKARQINRQQRVDAALLLDISKTEELLYAAGLERSVAHSLLGRSIFIAYLQDRKILSPDFFYRHFRTDKFTGVLNKKSDTYKLFEIVQKTFNGNLFPMIHKNGQNVHEQNFVKPEHLDIVQNLLSGAEMKTGQLRIWPYNFDVIPVELISSIYEMFAHASDSEAARERNTHYTPTNLVDLVLSQIFEGVSGDAKILDLSCGSGVFLVESFRRLVARRIANGEEWSRKVVRDTLHRQIYGVDISKEAVQIAAFSLYLTALELDPDPQPPSALKFRPLLGNNLFADDAFDENAIFNNQEPFAAKSFSVIVGNPPWKRTKANRLATEYCKRREYPFSRDNPDQAFLWRVGDFTNDNTRIGLILHGKPFFSHTPEALKTKKALLTRFKPQVMINLADLRQDWLFPTSDAPAMVLIAKGCRSQTNDDLSFVYFLFMTASVWGVERDEIQPIDLLRLPIPITTKDNESIVTRIVQIEEKLRRADDHSTQNLRQQLDEAVFDLYDMNEIERVLVQDAISLTIDLRMKQEKSLALKLPDDVELKKYAAHLISVILPFLQTFNERTMVAEVFNIGTAPLQVIKFSMMSTPSHRPAVQTVELENLEAVLEGIARQLPQRIADCVYTRRNLRIYAGDDLYVVKPAQRRYWSRSAGLNDADMIIAEHLGTNRDSIK